jgi:hypothetical protein
VGTVKRQQLAIFRPKMTPVGGPDDVAENHRLVVIQTGRRRKFDLNDWNHAQGGGGNARHLVLLRLGDDP